MFNSIQDSLSSIPKKVSKDYAPKTTVIEEQVMVGDTLVTRHVVSPERVIDRSLDASTFSLAQSIAREVNLDPSGPYFTQSTEEFSAAVSSYPDNVEPSKSE